MHNSTTFTFVPQGWAIPSVLAAVERKEGYAREEALRRAEASLQAELGAELVEEVGEPGQPRSGVARTGTCRRCESRLRADFRRNGPYRRKLLVLEGMIELRVPMVRCRCGGYVNIEWQVLAKRGRVWVDVRLTAIRHYLGGSSYRKAADAVSTRAAVHVSHLVGWRAMQKAGCAGRMQPSIKECPETVILDEMYAWVAGKKKPFLLAVDCQGRILGHAGPTARSADEWQKLLEGLSERGVSPEHGLKSVVADGDSAIQEAVALVWGQVPVQDCVWHVLARVRDQANQLHGNGPPLVTSIVRDARNVLLHEKRTDETRAVAAGKMAEFVKKHEGRPWVNKVARAFARATAYLQSPYLPRTNGTAERTIKERRRRIKTMDGLRSHDGAMNFMAVFAQCHNTLRESSLIRARLPRRANLKVRDLHPKLA